MMGTQVTSIAILLSEFQVQCQSPHIGEGQKQRGRERPNLFFIFPSDPTVVVSVLCAHQFCGHELNFFVPYILPLSYLTGLFNWHYFKYTQERGQSQCLMLNPQRIDRNHCWIESIFVCFLACLFVFWCWRPNLGLRQTLVYSLLSRGFMQLCPALNCCKFNCCKSCFKL